MISTIRREYIFLKGNCRFKERVVSTHLIDSTNRMKIRQISRVQRWCFNFYQDIDKFVHKAFFWNVWYKVKYYDKRHYTLTYIPEAIDMWKISKELISREQTWQRHAKKTLKTSKILITVFKTQPRKQDQATLN